MAENIKNITICMGSSCFSRGNKKTLGFLQTYLKEKGLNGIIELKGAHCMNECDKGPVVKIDDQFVYHATEMELEMILDKKLGFQEA